MIDIAYLERQKTEIVADHVRREGLSPLSEAEQWIIKELDWQIKQLADKGSDNNDTR